MELIQKSILRIMTTGATAPCSHRDPDTGILITGCTAMTKYLIPDTGVTYQLKILLTQNTTDIGFLDAYMIDTPYDYINITASNPNGLKKFEKYLSGGTTLAASGLVISHSNGHTSGESVNIIPYTVTGASLSRLAELRKYSASSLFANQYFNNGSYTVDGVDYPHSIAGIRIVYYLGGIKYIDLLTGATSGTTFSFTGQYPSNDFINERVYKDPNKENIISNPKISNDVFIIRQELSAFDSNYRLEFIKNMVDLETYAGGNFFNIIKNS